MAFDPHKYLAEKGAGPSGGGAFDPQAYLQEKGQGAALPPPIVPDGVRGPGPWADEYRGYKPRQPGADLPSINPTADEEKEWSDAPITTKLGRFFKGDLPFQRSANRFWEAKLAQDPELRAMADADKAITTAGKSLVTGAITGGAAGAGLTALRAAGPVITTGSKLLNAAVPALARVGSAGAEGAIAGATGEGVQAADEGRPVLPAAAEGAEGGLVAGTVLGSAGELAAKAGRGLANLIRGSRGRTGQNIRLLEKYGYTPSPWPTKPVTRLDDIPARPGSGPPLPSSPSEALGVEATAFDRGKVGSRAAEELVGELASRDQRRRNLLTAARIRNNTPGGNELFFRGQGTRPISTEPLIENAENAIGSQEAKMLPGIKTHMGNHREFLAETPDHVRTAAELDRQRDILDDLGRVAEREGLSKKDLPMANAADQIRAQLREHAPDVASANARAHARFNKNERARELMKDEAEIPESLGAQLAARGELGSRVAGTREPRLERLKREFPTRPGFPRSKVEELMDRPALLNAEEQMEVKRIPLGGVSVGTKVMNLPVVSRGVYPTARALASAGKDVPVSPLSLMMLLARAQRAKDAEGGR